MKRPLVITAILVALAGAIFASVRYYLDSRLPRATATIQVIFSTIPADKGAGQIMPGPSSSPFEMSDFVETSLDSPEVTQAAQEAGITKDGEVDRARLIKIARAEPIRGTDYFEIVVKHKSRAHAISLANAFATAIVRGNEEHNQERVKTRQQALKDELALKEEHFEIKGQHLRSLMEKFTLPIPKLDHPFPEPDLIPKFTNEDSADYSARQESYQEALKVFQESQIALQEITTRFPEESAAIVQWTISMIIHNYAN